MTNLPNTYRIDEFGTNILYLVRTDKKHHGLGSKHLDDAVVMLIGHNVYNDQLSYGFSINTSSHSYQQYADLPNLVWDSEESSGLKDEVDNEYWQVLDRTELDALVEQRGLKLDHDVATPYLMTALNCAIQSLTGARTWASFFTVVYRDGTPYYRLAIKEDHIENNPGYNTYGIEARLTQSRDCVDIKIHEIPQERRVSIVNNSTGIEQQANATEFRLNYQDDQHIRVEVNGLDPLIIILPNKPDEIINF